MQNIFHESFSTETDNIPGGWYVEQNSDMPQVPALECGEKCVEFLSAGNKFIPVIPDTADCNVKFSAKVNYEAAEHFGFMVCFRYDIETGEGQYIRFENPADSSEVVLHYGTTKGNNFTPECTQSITAKKALFNKEMDFELAISGNTLQVRLFDKEELCFQIKKGTGKIAFAREHFWDVLKITSLEILGDKVKAAAKPVTFTVPLPDTPTWYPLFCDVTLTDYGNCLDADLSIHGGVAETPVGEGNYHGIRSDILTRPYLKVLTERDTKKHVVYGKTLVLIPPGIGPKYLYKVVYEKPQWPFQRKVRFIKPQGEFDLAVGFENYHHNTLPDLEMDFAETVFTTKGKVLYSGSSIEEKERRVIRFQSQKNKEIIKRLPKKDPRYDMAVKFAEENHYFMEKEKAQFKINIRSASQLPALYEVVLEDAFLREVKQLDFEAKTSCGRMGVKEYNQVEITVEGLKDLACGIWHLRVRSIDPSAKALEDYCTFEVMSRKEDSPAPALLSGLPFLYDSRTETRGLMTDAFDPWKNTQMNNGHYISCANFLPPAARKYQVYPTTKAYGRKNFAWIGSRCLDDWSIEGNMDIINGADYVNISEHVPRSDLTWGYRYAGKRLQIFIDFLNTVKDPEFDIPAMKKLLKEKNKYLPVEITKRVFEKYWEEWQDFANERIGNITEDLMKKLRKKNPKLSIGQYGPFHIYAGHLKGPECIRMLCNEKSLPGLYGFWQYEDYPISCGYGFERGLYTLTSCLMAMPGSSIYPEIYTGGRLKQGCPDGAVFYAHPPFGIDKKDRSPKTLKRQIANFAFATGHLTKDGFHFWEKRGFQSCRFTRKWFESILTMWPYVLEHAPERPARTAAYISSEDSRRAQKEVMIEVTHGVFIDTRKTATEDVPYIYECALKAAAPAGFQMFDQELEKLTPSQVDTLVLPPLKGMSKKALQQIRKLHEAGVNLVGNEDVSGLEDLFGVKDTGKKKCITKVTPTGDFCAGMSEYCDDERCQGRYIAKDAEVLLAAEIPVLTLKHNKKASAAFFNVAPHLVREERLKQRMGYGRTGISSLMETAIGELMKSFSQTGVRVSAGRLIVCHTKDGKLLVIVSNPDDENELSVRIEIDKAAGVKGDPDVNFDVTLLNENKAGAVYRSLIPGGEVLMMLFDKQK